MSCKVCAKYYYTKKVYDDGLVWVYQIDDKYVFCLKQHSDTFPTCAGAKLVRKIYESRIRPDAKHRKRLQQMVIDGHLVIAESDIDTLHC